jgi:hypothetical protein
LAEAPETGEIKMGTDSTKIYLGAVTQGERITVSVITATSSAATIVLLDDRNTYAALQKSASAIPQILTPVTAVYSGGSNLRLEISIPGSQAASVKSVVNHVYIMDGTGGIKGGAYTVALEDSDDNDYNDYVITVTSTKKAE